MDRKPRAAGGLFVLLGFIGGTLYGGTKGQIVIGALAGVAAGLLLAGATWFWDSRRR